MLDTTQLVIDGMKEKVAFALPKPALDYIDRIASLSGERNRSAALRRIIREHARFQSDLETGVLKRIPQKTAA